MSASFLQTSYLQLLCGLWLPRLANVANVDEQIAMIRQRFPLSVDEARAFLQFLDNKNLIYKAADHRLARDRDLETVMQPSNFIMDHTNDSDNKVSPKLVNSTSVHIIMELPTRRMSLLPA